MMIAVLACCRCGAPLAPSSSLVGDWSGRVAPLHFAWLSIRFTQQGSTITGVACYQDPEGAADGKGILFSSVPVTVDYPDITVEAQRLVPVPVRRTYDVRRHDSRAVGRRARHPVPDVAGAWRQLLRALAGRWGP
jgi:hypothetical protein